MKAKTTKEPTGRICQICGEEIFKEFNSEGICIWAQWYTCCPECQNWWNLKADLAGPEFSIKGIRISPFGNVYKETESAKETPIPWAKGLGKRINNRLGRIDRRANENSKER